MLLIIPICVMNGSFHSVFKVLEADCRRERSRRWSWPYLCGTMDSFPVLPMLLVGSEIAREGDGLRAGDLSGLRSIEPKSLQWLGV